MNTSRHPQPPPHPSLFTGNDSIHDGTSLSLTTKFRLFLRLLVDFLFLWTFQLPIRDRHHPKQTA